MSILLNLLLVIYVLVAVLMILIILMQRPKSEGLGAAFGGGVTDNIFGAQTTNVLTKITGWLAGIFFFLTFALSVMYAHRTNPTSGLSQELMRTSGTAPAAPATNPAPSGAVGAPGTVTNPTPGAQGGDAAGQAQPLTPADQAVGITAPAVPPSAPAPSASSQPQP